MGISVNAQEGTISLGKTGMDIVEIKPVRAGVNLHRHTKLAGSLYYLVKMNTVGLPLQQQATGGMAQDVNPARLQCLDNPLGHLVSIRREPLMQRAQDEIQHLPGRIGNVNPSLRQYVRFQAGQDTATYKLITALGGKPVVPPDEADFTLKLRSLDPQLIQRLTEGQAQQWHLGHSATIKMGKVADFVLFTKGAVGPAQGPCGLCKRPAGVACWEVSLLVFQKNHYDTKGGKLV